MDKIILYFLIPYIIFNISCDRQRDVNTKSNKINIFVTIPPQAFFVNRIGANLVSVNVMIPESYNPHTYDPSPKQLINLNKARLVIKLGVPGLLFEKRYFSKILLDKNIEIVNMSMGIKFHYSEHGHDGHNHDSEVDPHIWLSPSIVKVCSENIYRALIRLDPKNKDIYEKNFNSFIGEINALDSYIKSSLRGLKNRTFIVYHSSLGYFAKDYGLTQFAIESEKKTSARNLKKIVDIIKLKNIKVIFIQKGYSKDNAMTIANGLGARIVEVNPLSGDWINNMKKIANTFKKSL